MAGIQDLGSSFRFYFLPLSLLLFQGVTLMGKNCYLHIFSNESQISLTKLKKNKSEKHLKMRLLGLIDLYLISEVTNNLSSP